MTLLFGRYEYVRELGAGATGRVLLVHDRGEAGAARAIKVVPAQRAQLLVWEFSKLRSLEHPFLARVHELLTLERAHPELGLARGSVLLVEEFVDGLRWGAFARSFGDDAAARERALFASALCITEALRAVHDAGLVHGDVKPDNVLVNAATGEAKLVDFGFARAPGHELPARGTPRFMAPEMLAGTLTQAGDVFALGTSLQDLLTGEGESSAGLPSTGLAALSPAFAALIAQLTAREACARPGDAHEALSALLVTGKQLGMRLPAQGERYAFTRPARAPDVLARRALALPFVPYGGAVDALVAALERHELVLLRGARGSGCSRLALEALRSLNVRQ